MQDGLSNVYSGFAPTHLYSILWTPIRLKNRWRQSIEADGQRISRRTEILVAAWTKQTLNEPRLVLLPIHGGRFCRDRLCDAVLPRCGREHRRWRYSRALNTVGHVRRGVIEVESISGTYTSKTTKIWAFEAGGEFQYACFSESERCV